MDKDTFDISMHFKTNRKIKMRKKKGRFITTATNNNRWIDEQPISDDDEQDEDYMTGFR